MISLCILVIICLLNYYFSVLASFFKVKADALHGVGADLRISHGHVFGVCCIGFECGGTFERGIKHHVAIRRVETAVNVHFNAYESVDFALQTFEARFDFSFLRRVQGSMSKE